MPQADNPPPPSPPGADPETQRELWNLAVEAIGGISETARRLGVTVRTMRALCSGERAIHDGFLRDISAELVKQASHCRDLERHLSPAFTANLTPRQLAPPAQGQHSRYDRREQGEN